MKKHKVIIDTDPAIGIPFKDVDDALAILLLLSSPHVDVLGITVNFGNVGMRTAYEKAKEILHVAGREDIPVFKGAENKSQLGKETESSRFIIQMLKKYSHEVTILAIAPLTNIATVVQREPVVLKLAKEIVIMGGAVKNFPFAEFNFFKDGIAAKTVLTYPVRKILFPVDICMQTTFSWRDFLKLRGVHNPVSDYLCKNIFSWLMLNIPYTAGRGFYPWDTVAAAYIVNEALFRCEGFIIDEKNSKWWRGLIKLKTFHSRSSDASSITIPVQLLAGNFKKSFLSHMENFTKILKEK